MNIRQTNTNDIDSVMKTYSIARKFMFENGNKTQWENGYPSLAMVINDIEDGESFVCVDSADNVLGVFFYAVMNEPTYSYIRGAWINDEPYGVIHRLASNGTAEGVAAFCFDWCLNRYPNLKIDTHENNLKMIYILEKFGFTRCGDIYLADGAERIAFQIRREY